MSFISQLDIFIIIILTESLTIISFKQIYFANYFHYFFLEIFSTEHSFHLVSQSKCNPLNSKFAVPRFLIFSRKIEGGRGVQGYVSSWLRRASLNRLHANNGRESRYAVNVIDLSVSSSPFQRSFTLARPFLPPRRSGRAFPSPRSSANPVRENEKFSWRLVDASALDRSLLCALRVRSRGDNCWEGRSTRFVLRDVEPSSAMGRCDRGLRVLRRIRFKILFSDFLSVRKVQSIPVESNFLSIFSD